MPGPWGRASLSRKLVTPLLAVGSWAAGGGSASCGQVIHTWYDHRYEYMHLECWILLGLVTVATIFEVSWHHFQHHVAGHHSHSDEHHHDEALHKAFDQFKTDTKPLSSTMAHRASGELMVLGFLAFVVWCFNRAGSFNAINCGMKYVKYIAVPSDPSDYLHTVEDVHMHLFLAMCMFVAIMCFAAFRVSKIQEEWHELNEGGVATHIQSPHEIIMLKGNTGKRHKRFEGSRYLFLWRLQRAAVDGKIPEEVCEVIEDAGEEHNGEEPEKHQYCKSMLTWFPFDQYVSLQCHRMVGELVEIKLATWVYLLFFFIVDALMIAATKGETIHWVIIAIELVSALVLGAVVPITFNRQKAETMIQELKEASEIASLEEAALGMQGFAKKFFEVQAVPMWAAQLIVFCWSYHIVKIVASTFWWDESPSFAITCTALGLISIPLYGILAAEIVARMSIWIARGDTGLREEHIMWVRVIAHQKIMSAAHKKHEESRKDIRTNRAATPTGAAAGSSHV